MLAFNLRHLKEKIQIKKDSHGINWVLNEDTELIEDHIDLNVLSIIHTLAKHPSKQLEGSCQELSARINYTENPKGLYRFLERHRDTLIENNVTFSKTRNGQKRQISLVLKDDDTEQ